MRQETWDRGRERKGNVRQYNEGRERSREEEIMKEKEVQRKLRGRGREEEKEEGATEKSGG